MARGFLSFWNGFTASPIADGHSFCILWDRYMVIRPKKNDSRVFVLSSGIFRLLFNCTIDH